jgi:hypothetical protein
MAAHRKPRNLVRLAGVGVLCVLALAAACGAALAGGRAPEAETLDSPWVASDGHEIVSACPTSGKLTGVPAGSSECPPNSVTAASPSPLPAPSSSASPSPSAPPAPAPSTPAPTPTPTQTPAPTGRMNCTTNQNGGANDNVTQLDNDTYHLQANEYNSDAVFTICTNGNPDFTISSPGVNVSHDGAPGAYPSLYKGCHWGYCTSNSGMPVPVSTMSSTPNEVTTSWRL